MYIRLYGRVYGYDIEKNENDEYVAVGDSKLIGNFKKPLIIDATKQIVARRYYDVEVFGHEILGDKYVVITGQHTRLLLPGDAVILSRTNEKVVVYGSGRKSFSASSIRISRALVNNEAIFCNSLGTTIFVALPSAIFS